MILFFKVVENVDNFYLFLVFKEVIFFIFFDKNKIMYGYMSIID